MVARPTILQRRAAEARVSKVRIKLAVLSGDRYSGMQACRFFFDTACCSRGVARRGPITSEKKCPAIPAPEFVKWAIIILSPGTSKKIGCTFEFRNLGGLHGDLNRGDGLVVEQPEHTEHGSTKFHKVGL